jgi:hypothetical protein
MDALDKLILKATIELANVNAEFKPYKKKIKECKTELGRARARTLIAWTGRAIVAGATGFLIHCNATGILSAGETAAVGAGLGFAFLANEGIYGNTDHYGKHETRAIKNAVKELKQVDRPLLLAKKYSEIMGRKDEQGLDAKKEKAYYVKHVYEHIAALPKLKESAENIDKGAALDWADISIRFRLPVVR